MASHVRNLNDRLSQNENSITFDNEYYFEIPLAGDLRSLSPRARCLAKNKIQNIFFKHQMSANSFGESSKSSLNNSHSDGTVQPFNTIFHHPPRLVPPSRHLVCTSSTSPQIPLEERIIKMGSQEELKCDLLILLHILDLT